MSYTPYLFREERPERLTIIDPNRSSNNISGGTRLIEVIFQCFSDALTTLQSALAQASDSQAGTSSILATILGSDFELYESQRDALYELHYGTKRPMKPAETVPMEDAPIHTDTTDQMISDPVIPNGESSNLNGTGSVDEDDSPDVAHLVGDKLTRGAALTIGGYKNGGAMARDLDQKQKNLSKEARRDLLLSMSTGT